MVVTQIEPVEVPSAQIKHSAPYENLAVGFVDRHVGE